jgi:tetratricopeptide (TPR) repeat protein
LELAPNSDDAYRRLGDAFRANHDKKEALASYDRAIQLNRYYWFNYNALGSACVLFSEFPRALDAFRHVTELEPDNASGYRNLGAVYFAMGEYEKAVPILQKSIEIEKHPIGYSNLGTSYFYLRRYDDAVAMFKEAVSLDPSPNEFHLGNLADAYRWANKTPEANATYDQALAQGVKALAVNPRDAVVMGRMALYYAKKGENARSADYIRRARAIDSDNPTLLYQQGVIQWLGAHADDALPSLQQALSKGYSLREVQNDPELSKLEALPKFAEMLKQIPQKPN